ncbi:pepsin A [Babesia ovis]|uniref:Pepsin A n=1 Tax=Babesia ovis TaxID=5869 RepID=A0A9W5WVD7_BABOV|nr:pepsin A [Babesia ovis]
MGYLEPIDTAQVDKAIDGGDQDIMVYNGPRPKMVLPLIPTLRDDDAKKASSQLSNLQSIPATSLLLNLHRENLENALAGRVTHVFVGQGPNGSLGVDPLIRQRHEERLKAAQRNHVIEKVPHVMGTTLHCPHDSPTASDDSHRHGITSNKTPLKECSATHLTVATDIPNISSHQSNQKIAEVKSGSHETNRVHTNVITRQENIYPRLPSNAYLSFSNLRHTTFAIEAYIGTPHQKFLPMLDTGSTNVWAVHPECTSDGCVDSTKFHPEKSTTFKHMDKDKQFIRAKFVSGVVLGELGYDDFTIGGVTVKNQIFAMLRSIPDEKTNTILRTTRFDGMIGLGFKDLMAVDSEPLYQRYMKALGAEPIFSFYYSLDGENSAFMIGGADERLHIGKLQMMPVVPGYYWQVDLKEVWIGTTKVCCDGEAYAIFDTGTAFNSMPHDAIQKLLEIYAFHECDSTNVHRNFKHLPTIRYVFRDGIEAQLTPDQYTYESGGICRPAYMQINVDVGAGKGYLLGSMGFMPHYYTVYYGGSNPMIGIAPSNHKNAPQVLAEYKPKHK